MEEQNNCITETTIGRQHNNNAYTPAEQNNCITGTTIGRQHNNNAYTPTHSHILMICIEQLVNGQQSMFTCCKGTNGSPNKHFEMLS
jgi:cysteine synthase